MTIKPTRTNHFKVFQNGVNTVKVREGMIMWYPMDMNRIDLFHPHAQPHQPSNVSDFGTGTPLIYMTEEEEFDIFESCRIYLKMTFQVALNSERVQSLLYKDTPEAYSDFAMLKYKTLHSPEFSITKEGLDFEEVAQSLGVSYDIYFRLADIDKEGSRITVRQRHSNAIIVPKMRHYINSANIV